MNKSVRKVLNIDKTFFYWMLFISMIMIVGLRRIIPELPNDFYLYRFVDFINFKEINLLVKDDPFLKIIKSSIQYSIILFPIIGITIIEFFSSKESFRNRFWDTSLGRIRLSQGTKGSEIWFYFY